MKFIILSEPRTGSNNISYFLNSHPNITCANEIFHPQNGIKKEDLLSKVVIDESAAESQGYHWIDCLEDQARNYVLDKIMSRYNGFKIHTQHLSPQTILKIVEKYECKIIMTIRRCIFEQAVSNFIATHVGKWHADEHELDKISEASCFNIGTNNLLNWINELIRMRAAIRSALSNNTERVFICEYETLFSGTVSERFIKFQWILDFLGIQRFGELPDGQRSLAIAKAIHFLEPKKQKMTKEEDIEKLVLDLPQLRSAYDKWRTSSFSILMESM